MAMLADGSSSSAAAAASGGGGAGLTPGGAGKGKGGRVVVDIGSNASAPPVRNTRGIRVSACAFSSACGRRPT